MGLHPELLAATTAIVGCSFAQKQFNAPLHQLQLAALLPCPSEVHTC
jgi:hypothetical protein